ncbi:[glutamine synthetase] adenylyltransferase/[glutamine synthetase]-adenylyl-L-tyrosine phosphorylase [Methylomarinovum tepidoasis]|uniref:Bifunctional glutamine synthetase adenylyltransferase/adenylyl-removing enzyme n=1 Tax=Methylomarinovum tepidoasis TaxID=2840183 RepID=A0AAU9CAN6_9GAMM|nr:bifunctional [glutamate--ammonia ligase]-adenylyl-L-tyrosine phosphorylase/[glutamate--ammonia-ligase] adenylyltransferase [Methylomarinovum sp. IN45]BCX89550.1 [glutamine synthetase] adenylyltransferase/[glutamine synthetase]-adenylyl-L-tyrosine phosphorylase [Methylomarinovum sp. IN45]
MTLPPPDFSALPADLAESVRSRWQQFIEACEREEVDLPGGDWLASLPRVWACSEFVAHQCIRHPQFVADLVVGGDLFRAERRGVYRSELERLLGVAETPEDLHRILRRFRNREMVRIAWRDICGWDAIEDVLCDLSLLAEGCIQAALDWLFARACQRYGTPRCPDGRPQLPVVLGMGKLGGWELNFSSDIDLIFAYEHDGVLEDRRGTSYQEFYLRLCRDLVKALNAQTEDGFVFRVDTRLRPFGDAGPLVWSFEAMDLYYQGQARDWERYAMIKARPVAGDIDAGARLMALLKPFVYRRYLDYRALEALRELKRKIAAELQRRDRLDDVKLGPGGIREIEFIAQVFQLIHGGRRPRLQERRLLPTLARLGQMGLLPREDSDDLIEAYRFLRRVENRLQQWRDQQTQKLPETEMEWQRLALGLGFDDAAGLRRRLEAVRGRVQQCFDQVFAEPEARVGGAGERVWRLAAEAEDLREILTQLGYRDAGAVLRRLEGLRQARALRSLGAETERILERLMPALIESVGRSEQPDATLLRMLDLIEAIAGRSAYLSLLAENPQARTHLIRLVGASPWIARLLSRHPALLDELLDPRQLYAPLKRAQLQAELAAQLAVLDPDDEEAVLNQLRYFKHAQVLRVAAADLSGAIPTNVVSDYLTEIAEVILAKTLELAWRHVSAKHGPPPGATGDVPKDFAIIGYGKLGGIELGYGSDLDLVFLYQGDANAETGGARPVAVSEFFIRLGRRIIHILTAPVYHGVLYEIDMRLRPSGNAGLLVTSLAAFARYQLEEAWTWEHQALVRARPVAGDAELAQGFAAVRREILCHERDPAKLRREVIDMRLKMREHLDRSDAERFDLKQGVGGMVDIEFIVQFGCLAHARRQPEAFRWSDNLRLLDALAAIGWLEGDDAAFLQQTYLDYRSRAHRLALQEQPALVPQSEFRDRRARVEALWRRLIETATGEA